MRVLLLISIATFGATAHAAKVTVPADLGIGPAGYWFFSPITANRGAIPNFGIAFDLAAVIDRDWLDANRNAVPAQYQGMADKVKEVRIGPSIFIPSALYISPPFDAFGSVGMFGATWTPIGLTLINTGQNSIRDWNRSRGRVRIDANLLLTYLFVFNTMGYVGVPTTHFLRPGAELRLSILINVTSNFILGLGGGGQIYIPQRMGSFFEVAPITEAMWIATFAFLQFHFRFPYEANL